MKIFRKKRYVKSRNIGKALAELDMRNFFIALYHWQQPTADFAGQEKKSP